MIEKHIAWHHCTRLFSALSPALPIAFCAHIQAYLPKMQNQMGSAVHEQDVLNHNEIHGVIVLARNGDRYGMYQNPETYAASATETTPLGEVQSHTLGADLRATYLDPTSSSYIKGMRGDVVDNKEVHVRVKAGGEGTVVFDSAIALLQGLFPPTLKNKITLPDDTTVIAPLGGYQYVPVETVEPGNDRSLESWTNCPAFQKHVKDFYKSDEFKAKAEAAKPFFTGVKDFIFGPSLNLENMWNVYDYVNSELSHNKTYAYRLPPTYINQARAFANYHENGVFSDSQIDGIGNIAGRTVLYTILSNLQRIAFNDDPLQFLLIESTYQPFISLFHQTEIFKEHPELQGIPNYASALAIELRRGSPPDARDFLRFRFKNGTEGNWQTLNVLGHHSDIALTEFIYKTEASTIRNNKQWAQVCGNKGKTLETFGYDTGIPAPSSSNASFFVAAFLLLFLSLFVTGKYVRKVRKGRALRLHGEEQQMYIKPESGSVPVMDKTRYQNVPTSSTTYV